MTRRARIVWAGPLLLLSVAGTLVTAHVILHNGFVASRSASVAQTAIRIVVIVGAVCVWPFTHRRFDRITLACWIIAAASSALFYGLGMNTTLLQVIRTTRRGVESRAERVPDCVAWR